MTVGTESQGYTVSQVAKKLGVSRRTVERYIHTGKLPKVERLEGGMIAGRFGPEYRILEIPEELLARKREREQKGRFKPSGGNLTEERRVGEQVIVETRVVRMHWGVYVAIAICLGLAIAGLVAALHALDVAYWIGGG